MHQNIFFLILKKLINHKLATIVPINDFWWGQYNQLIAIQLVALRKTGIFEIKIKLRELKQWWYGKNFASNSKNFKYHSIHWSSLNNKLKRNFNYVVLQSVFFTH